MQAEKLMQAGVAGGGWLLLQNCHLAPSWMVTLAHMVEGLAPASTHPGFRLLLTSYPTPQFPPSLLQNCVKMTAEPAKVRPGLPPASRPSLASATVAVVLQVASPATCKREFVGAHARTHILPPIETHTEGEREGEGTSQKTKGREGRGKEGMP